MVLAIPKTVATESNIKIPDISRSKWLTSHGPRTIQPLFPPPLLLRIHLTPSSILIPTALTAALLTTPSIHHSSLRNPNPKSPSTRISLPNCNLNQSPLAISTAFYNARAAQSHECFASGNLSQKRGSLVRERYSRLREEELQFWRRRRRNGAGLGFRARSRAGD